MKKILSITFCFLFLVSYGQDTIVSYLDKTKKNIVLKDKAYFTQVSFKTNSTWIAILYNLKGELVSEESFSSSKLNKKFGEQKYFYPNEKLRFLKTYTKNEKLEGRFMSFYDDGKKSMVGIYKDDKRVGVWNFYYRNENKKARLIYKNDKIIKHNLWFENGTVRNEELIFERRPKFKGMEPNKSFQKYFRRKLSSKKCLNPFQGRLIVKFTINTNGKAEQIIVLPENLPEDCKKNVLIIFENMPNWEPGIQLNNKVNIKYTIPVKLN